MVERSKIDAQRQRQQNFLTQINVYPSYDIIQLDYSRKAGTEPTLRQMIMSIKQKDSDSLLFHSIDLDWRGEAFNFQFCKTVKVVYHDRFTYVEIDDFFRFLRTLIDVYFSNIFFHENKTTTSRTYLT